MFSLCFSVHWGGGGGYPSQVLGQGQRYPPPLAPLPVSPFLPPPQPGPEQITLLPLPPDRTRHGQYTARAVRLLCFHAGGLSCT